MTMRISSDLLILTYRSVLNPSGPSYLKYPGSLDPYTIMITCMHCMDIKNITYAVYLYTKRFSDSLIMNGVCFVILLM
jgi:hypothetical protein